ncbi:MAG TPA: aspartate aminotransferase family protein [Acidimicrobiaceae bacterium]|jgi:adenosylmethionine-8-amino-7-oxononanoate aminotransferase|nr:aspartate aminotransferase family protein [Acidimicrobiaceae bacterium]MDP7258715.1 aminotransferase class III-fold pyridoxal phosphate-dependent enzyme [Acidimicrobiales bacterium]HCV37034.1 aspartate aminotransferase family protein [Acidimicrobiaceae bacterium]HJO79301.1 aminotransferase class III-fold pyridoxal phosphate-dependent enzyme [Acidimicrobiales bacterium]|tara:strand:+ start:9864 stop:11069 length:1206 start_codon:yes stop_codon:yes gene_type:complete
MTNALLHPFAPPNKPESDYLNIVRGEGSLVFDSSGKSYIDGIANLWLCQVGHGRTEIIDAVATQMRQIEAYHTFAPFSNGPAAQVAEMIVERSPLVDGRVFLGCSGSDAVDTALKIARLFQQRRGHDGRQIIVKRTNGYHGTNFGGTSAQGITLNREGWGDLIPHFIEVPHDDLEVAATIFAEHGERIAAVLTEPIQGGGGVHPPVDGYLEGLHRLCEDNGALLIFDEVICGFGRTGNWFGAQTFGVTPDLIIFAKGVTSGYQPLSGVIVSRDVCNELEEPDFLLRTGYTYSGHHASCAAGIANIELMETEGLVDRVDNIGSQLRSGLAALKGDGLIESWRGLGAIYAAELGNDAVSARDKMLSAGVILRPIGTCLAICPPLVITDDEISRLIDTMADALR